MNQRILCKGLALTVILFFIQSSVIPLICGEEVSEINGNVKITQKNLNQEQPTKRALIIGRIENLVIYGNFAVFNAIKTRVITFNPFSFVIYYSVVMLLTFGSKLGILTNNFVLGLFNVTIYIT